MSFDRTARLGAAAAVALALVAVTIVTLAQTTGSVWDGLYTEEQAKRGRTAYLKECTECHGEDLTGGETAPPLLGREFVEFWSDTSLGELYELTVETMPEENPGELGAQTYADLLAYMLQANKFPAGEEELEPDVDRLFAIAISPEP